MYHELNADSSGTVSKKWCHQMNNETLFDCSQNGANPEYMRLAPNAQQVWRYTRPDGPGQYYIDVINAFIKLTSIPAEGDSGSYVNYFPRWICVNGQPKCAGDLFFQGCAGLLPLSCSA